mmetsp:Transcript_37605/g.97030  ORF Transcript_37605/g.97030 Transcript_37605/m.97030 type:complete len:121 (-) Transcript_37605:725-1087(-)
MPKSKRQRVVPLTETRKKGLERKTSLVEEVRSCLEKYDKVILFEYQNFRNKKMKEMRESLTDSRFFLGRNAVTAKALGTTVEEEAAEGVHDIAIVCAVQNHRKLDISGRNYYGPYDCMLN